MAANSHYVNFVDFSQDFDSVHWHSFWKILRAYRIPSLLVKAIKSFYDNFTCCVGDGYILFEVHTGVRQGCVMSTLLFNLVVDWIMRHTTEDQIRGIRWAPFTYLEDLDYADDLALLSHTPRKASWPQHQQQEDQNYGTECYWQSWPVQVDNEELPHTDRFAYLGNVISRDGGT